MKRIVNQTNTIIAIVWPHRVRLMDITVLRSGWPAPRASAAARVLELAAERVREGEVQRHADSDLGSRVGRGHAQEHLGLQHRRALRLARCAFPEATGEQAH